MRHTSILRNLQHCNLQPRCKPARVYLTLFLILRESILAIGSLSNWWA
jgi:hypothetical protein